MAHIPVQYYDSDGNPVPVYITRNFSTTDQWYVDNTLYTLKRTFRCSDEVLMVISYHGGSGPELDPTDYTGISQCTFQYAYDVLTFAFTDDTTTKKYLYIHDDLTVGVMHYSYDYTYYCYNPLQIQPGIQSSLTTIHLDNTVFVTDFYMPLPANPNPQIPYKYPGQLLYPWRTPPYSPSDPDPYLLWNLDTSVPEPTLDRTSTDIGTTYIGLYATMYNTLWYNVASYDFHGHGIPFVMPLNFAKNDGRVSFYRALWDKNDITEGGDVVTSGPDDRLTYIYKKYSQDDDKEYFCWDVSGGKSEITIIVEDDLMLQTHFCNIYLPSDSQMDDFYRWLWNGSLSAKIDKMFGDPMDGFLSYKVMKFNIPATSSGPWILGNIEADLADNNIPQTNQIIHTISCGEKEVPEYFGNVLDYSDTTWELYLPFIGFVPLNTAEITGASVSISYKVDILTGTCCATVSVTKNNNNIQLYTYSGNCSMEMPISSASYQNATGAMLGAVATTAVALGTIATTGGLSAPLAVGAMGAGVNAVYQNDAPAVKRSGNMSANSGFLAWHKPYLVAHRPRSAMATNYEQYEGYPTNQLALLSNCSGYTRIKECHLESMTCTEEEKLEIERLLKQGVIL